MKFVVKFIVIFLLGVLLSSCAVTKGTPKNTLALFAELIEEAPVFQDNLLANEVIISGNIIELKTKEPAIFGSVALYNNGVFIQGAETNFDGHFSLRIANFNKESVYKLECGYLGFKTFIIKDINLSAGYEYKLNILMEVKPFFPSNLGCGPHYKVPLIDIQNTTSGQTITSDEIRRRAARGE